MKKLYATLLTTSFLFSLNTYATTVSSFQGLTDALGTADANVVFDASGVQNIDGWMTVKEGQSVALQNIASWTNTNHEFELGGNNYIGGTIPYNAKPTKNDPIGEKERLIMNYGTLSIDGLDVRNNKFIIASEQKGGVGYSARGGAFIQNRGVILNLSNVVADNNNIDTLKRHDFWGGLIGNISNGEIQKIENSTFSNNYFKTQQSAPHGAVIYNGKKIGTINNVSFINNTMTSEEGNSGGSHGTAIDNNQYGEIGSITKSKFINNRTHKKIGTSGHASGSAIDNYNIIREISDTLFQGNNVYSESIDSPVMGGAIKNLSYSKQASGAVGHIDKIINVDFIENYAKNIEGSAYGGAFSTGKDPSYGDSYTETMANVLFEKNYAQGDGKENSDDGAYGGAIYHYPGTIKTLNGKFIENYAISKYGKAQGGAIWNKGTIESIKDSEFTGNYATGGSESLGGAIYNEGTIGFEGTNIFKGNKTGNKLNDIYNTGIITVSGDLTLDGGITGTGAVTFKDGASLNATLNQTTILADSVTFEGNNKLSFVIGGDIESKTYEFIDATLTGSENVSIKENALYDLSLTDEGDITVGKKSADEIQKTLGQNMDKKSAEIITAVLSSKGSEKLAELSSEVSTIIQEGNFEKASKGAKELAPTDSTVVGQVAQSTNALLLNTIGNRVESTGRSGGDAFKNSSLWMKALYSNAEQESSSSSEGFEADTKGFVLGVDGKATEDLTIGVGYAYTQSEIDAGSREMDVDGHNAFAYAHYQPNKWYVNGVVSYGQSKYKETKTPLGMALRSEYDVKTYGATLMSGYNLENGITPEVGLRYLIVDQESYNDGVQTIETGKTDYLTAVVGAKFNTTTQINDWVVEPSARIYATYDLISDDTVATVSFAEGAGYQVKGESLDRFGIETGLGISATLNNIELSLDYLGGFKKDYQNHSGIIKAKYHF